MWACLLLRDNYATKCCVWYKRLRLERALSEKANTSYDSLQDLGQELLPNSSIFEVHRNYKIDSLSYVKFCQEFNFEDKNAQATFV